MARAAPARSIGVSAAEAHVIPTPLTPLPQLSPDSWTGNVAIDVLSGVAILAIAWIFGWLRGPLAWIRKNRDLKQIVLMRREFVLVYNPADGHAKTVTFLENGHIGEGRNANEHSWRIRRGALEILAQDGQLYNRFVLDKSAGRLASTNDPDIRAIYAQYFIPQYRKW